MADSGQSLIIILAALLIGLAIVGKLVMKGR